MRKFLLCLAATAGVFVACFVFWVAKDLYAISAYKPQVGDVVIQNIDPCGRLLRAVKAVSESEWCHCGVVDRKDGRWVVCEAVGGGVRYTDLDDFLMRGNRIRFVVYRLTDEFNHQADKFAKSCAQYLGRPYDSKYELDDEKIYCSELVYKAYESATGETLVDTQELSDLKWEGHEEDIKYYSESDDLVAVLEREVVTPVSLTTSPRLKKIVDVR